LPICIAQPNEKQRIWKTAPLTTPSPQLVTRALEKGVDVKAIAEWQGHRDGGKLILQTCSHVRPVHSRRMALLMTDQGPDNVVR
jgi:hypothetical protein